MNGTCRREAFGLPCSDINYPWVLRRRRGNSQILASSWKRARKQWRDGGIRVCTKREKKRIITCIYYRLLNSSRGRDPELTEEWLSEEGVCSRESDYKCAPSSYRSFDGSCNNLRHPKSWGVALRPYRRILLPDYSDGEHTSIMFI